jgi:hypothetical protein
MKDHAGTIDTLYALSVDPAMSKFAGFPEVEMVPAGKFEVSVSYYHYGYS